MRTSKYLDFYVVKIWLKLRGKKHISLAQSSMLFVKLHKPWPPVQNRSTDICKNSTFSTHEKLNLAGHIFHKCNGWLKTDPPLESACIHKGEREMRKTGVME